MRKYIIVLLLSGLFLLPVVLAYDVEMNFRYRIAENDQIYIGGMQQTADGNWTDIEKKYIASQSNGIVSGVVFAGSMLNGIGLKLYGSDYAFRMNQAGSDNRFLIVLTNGTYNTVDSKYESVGRMLSTSFGYSIAKVVNFPIVLQLQYDDIDITDSVPWQGQKTLQITNEGRIDGRVKISIKHIR